MEYKVNFKNQLKFLNNGIIRFTVVLLIYTLIASYIHNLRSYLIIISFYIVNVLFVLVLHFQYKNKSKNIVILKNRFVENIIYDTDGKSVILNLDGKEKIEVHLPPSMYRGGKMKMLPYEPYHYAIIITKDANYVITCLVMPNIMEEFDKLGIKYTKKWRAYPYIRKEYYKY
jgi:phosphoglycerol transferase MdoB-like AlkP superfamily enzyme